MTDRHADAVGRDLDWQAVRHRIGLTRKELASTLGCGYSTVSRWELEKAEPSLAYQRQMLSLLGESVADAGGGPHAE